MNRFKRIQKNMAHWIPIVVLFCILSAGFFFSADQISAIPLCFFKHIFQFDCPGCGLTRAFLSIPKGEILKAVQYNASSLCLYLLFFLMFLSLLMKRFEVKGFENSYVKWSRFFLSQLVIVLMLGHWILKLAIYFSEHSFYEYMTSLFSSGNLWLLWV